MGNAELCRKGGVAEVTEGRSELCPRIKPVIPPATNSDTNPIANSIAVVKRMRDPHNVPIQLNVFTAEGTPIESVNTENAIAE